MNNKVKQILIDFEIEGNGIVNFDHINQKWVYKEGSPETDHLRTNWENVSYAKKNFYRNDNGDLTYKLKLSSGTLKHNMFRNDIVAQTSSIQHSKVLLYSYIASSIGIIRGYMFTSKHLVKRKSPLNITDAEQYSTNKSYLETFSKSGEKDINKNKELSDNTYFQKETVGDILYRGQGNINLGDMQFVSCDSIFDRVAFDVDLYESLYKNYAEMNIPNFDAKLGYYTLSSSVVDMPEYGLVLSDSTTLLLVKETLKRMLNINIVRNGAYAKIKTLRIKLVSDPLVDTYTNKDNWIDINTIDDIDSLSFKIYSAYKNADYTKMKKLRVDIQKSYDEEQLKIKEKKSKLKTKKK